MQQNYFFFMQERLVIDWGNTRVKTARFKGTEMLELIVTSSVHIDDVFKLSGNDTETPVLLCSVSSKSLELEGALRKQFPRFIKLTHHTPVPIAVQYQTPETLGYDRLANAVAIARLAPNGSNALAIDVGTCLKFDFVQQKERYLGGAISPGINMRYQAMHEQTDGLPLLRPANKAALIGKTTEESMHSGAIEGMRSEIERVIQRYTEEFSPIVVFITGGDAQIFEKGLKNDIFAHSFLTLAGLNDILEFNQST